eukprot:CAMPEP_0170618848 /NCGR_PEP_ID=MMETSP0224-20130122/27183_1 /TAXON_ID=285029 /ORGANISM="Togula jolla, Strain CCCM 725" /LENGTH=39 /DNA_ID= /DNA_START= /DNA_END= /DNA_ORIENTATION=
MTAVANLGINATSPTTLLAETSAAVTWAAIPMSHLCTEE